MQQPKANEHSPKKIPFQLRNNLEKEKSNDVPPSWSLPPWGTQIPYHRRTYTNPHCRRRGGSSITESRFLRPMEDALLHETAVAILCDMARCRALIKADRENKETNTDQHGHASLTSRSNAQLRQDALLQLLRLLLPAD